MAQSSQQARREDPTAEWQKELDPLQHHVLREHGTERPVHRPLNNEKRAGTFRCAGCGEPLFDSATKYESGIGLAVVLAPMRGRGRRPRPTAATS